MRMFFFRKFAATAVCCILAIAPAASAAGDAGVILNGRTLDAESYIIDGSVYVPLRAIGEALGAEVSWDDASRNAILNYNSDSAVINAISKASESVVAIAGNYRSASMAQSAQDYNPLYAHGTGVVIKSSGTILTNSHVVEGLDNITVIFAGGDSYSGKITYSDPEADLAVVQINKLGLTPIKFAEENSLVVGQSVIAIGTPMAISHINSASRGIVSGVGVNIGAPYLFTQSDTAINGGNSGGPLINLNGELVGINSMKYAGSGVEGMSFSIPVDTINYVLKSFEKYGKVQRPDTGVTLAESWESKIGVPTKKGLSVTVSKNPLLEAGDTVNFVNGIEVHSIADYNEAIKKTYDGNSVVFGYERRGVTGEVVLTAKQ